MVNSTPIIVKSLSKELPQSFRDLTPVAAIIADYQALAVPLDSPYQSWPQLLAAYQENPAKVKIAGGSARGSLDHLVAAMTFKNAGADAGKLRYVAYDAGGSAMAAVLAGETQVLSTGFGEAMEAVKSGQMRILGMTAPTRMPDAGCERGAHLQRAGQPHCLCQLARLFRLPRRQRRQVGRIRRPAQTDV
ncbi:hypothetical protein C3B79_2463 [Aeromonas hydrophila]|uniref:tripartite tricarboxylate transporter substrate-binding protein n=1 Tax=Aeromonas hydrophila TaxID=644 RepID=UPI000FD16E51|nr:hypothetical protein C3B79_2463 [Aeromonas hydrophila]